MTQQTATEAVVLRDRSGDYYLVTPAMLERGRATAAQRAAIERQLGDDTAGFGMIRQIGNYQPFQLLGVLTVPAGPSFNPQPHPPGFNPQPDSPGFNPQPDPPGRTLA
jgi:hypothetical protein